MLKLCRWLLTKFYRIEVKGLDHYYQAGKRIVIIANHLSFLDAVIIALFMPEKMMFVVNSNITKCWYLLPFFKLVKVVAIDPSDPMATKAVIKEIKKDQKCVILPEGRITVTGSLMKIYEGASMIADRSEAKILPVRIEGAQYSHFSRLKGKVRLRWFPKITLHILAPQDFTIASELKGAKRRQVASLKLYDLMSQMLFKSSDCQKTLFASLLDGVHMHGRKHIIAEDILRSPISYGNFLTQTFTLSSQLNKLINEKNLGIMLPNMVSTLVTFMALQEQLKIPVMLNYSMGAKPLISACKTAQVKTIITSLKLVKQANLSNLIERIKKTDINVIYLEKLTQKLTLTDKATGLLKSLTASFFYTRQHNQNPQNPAVILFTSGTEGSPKGVVLSHINLQSNRHQISSRIDFSTADTIFNAMPMFHSFGLGCGTLLPLLSGVRIFLYPSPLHYRIVPELIYDINATIMFGTDTFLTGYARFANAYDFYSIRYIITGAEKLKEKTRQLWMNKYGIRLLEGYGTTETSPVLAINTPMQNRAGTVGRPLPGINCSLKKVPNIALGGRLVVEGPNIMKGYLLADSPGKLIESHGCYDTGDIVTIDEQGYIEILGRAKRFAKIAGEMISLASVESYLGSLWPDYDHAVINIADSQKGEALVLITNNKEATRKAIGIYAKSVGIKEISLPKKIVIVENISVLGSGKIDYPSLYQLVENSTKT